MRRRTLIMFVILSLVASACSSGDDDEPRAQPEPSRPEASILPPARPEDLAEPPAEEQPANNDDGRLVVQSGDAQLSTMLPDGSDAVALTDPGTINVQAAWAPDGSRLAWVATDASGGDPMIATDRFDRSDFRAMPIDETPFYLAWDPSASKIAHLTAVAGGLDLSIVEPFGEDGPTNRRVDRGQPYFFSWGPDGDELLVHASDFRLDRIDLGSATVIVDEFPASFGAATWLEDDSLVFADIEDDRQFLVTTGAAGEGRRPLITYRGALRFSVSNQGNRIAFQAVDLVEDEEPVVTASAPLGGHHEPDAMLVAQTEPTPTPGFDDSLDAIDDVLTGIPYVMGTFGGEPFPLSSVPAVAIFPSPDGQSVAWFEQAVPGDSTVLRLTVDTGGSTFVGPSFEPSDELATEYLPFFDQYSQSHDFWSPSSNLFVYAGRPIDADGVATGDDGIWVFDRTTSQITRIADGVVASFTHTPQAGGAASAV